jgi:copper(I)-binding protein
MKTCLKIIALAVVCSLMPEMNAHAETRVRDAWVRASLGASKVTAGYAVISNDSRIDDELISVSTPSAMMAYVHTTEQKGGIASMKSVNRLIIPAGGSVSLKPGALHIMLMNMPRSLKDGEEIELLFTFRDQGPVKVSAQVVSIAAEQQHRH